MTTRSGRHDSRLPEASIPKGSEIHAKKEEEQRDFVKLTRFPFWMTRCICLSNPSNSVEKPICRQSCRSNSWQIQESESEGEPNVIKVTSMVTNAHISFIIQRTSLLFSLFNNLQP